MIIWLASYPRSGNTLTRTILKQVFGAESYSIYDDPTDLSANTRVAETVGHIRHWDNWEDIYPQLRDDDSVHFVKTHGAPLDNGSAIFVVREPVSCFVSYREYFRKYYQLEIQPTEFAAGLTPFGGHWTGFLDSWNPDQRPNTLLLRYEELTANADMQIEKIAKFINREPLRTWANPFDELRQIDSNFFRRGERATDQSEISVSDANLIRYWSQRWLARLGYPVPPEVSELEVVTDAITRVGTCIGLRLRLFEDRHGEVAKKQSFLDHQQDELKKSISQIDSQYGELSHRLSDLDGRHSELSKQVSESDDRNQELSKQISQLDSRCHDLEIRLDDSLQRVELASQRLEELSGIRASFWQLVGNIDRRTGLSFRRRRAA